MFLKKKKYHTYVHMPNYFPFKLIEQKSTLSTELAFLYNPAPEAYFICTSPALNIHQINKVVHE